jgi:hypothetical protein
MAITRCHVTSLERSGAMMPRAASGRDESSREKSPDMLHLTAGFLCWNSFCQSSSNNNDQHGISFSHHRSESNEPTCSFILMREQTNASFQVFSQRKMSASRNRDIHISITQRCLSSNNEIWSVFMICSVISYEVSTRKLNSCKSWKKIHCKLPRRNRSYPTILSFILNVNMLFLFLRCVTRPEHHGLWREWNKTNMTLFRLSIIMTFVQGNPFHPFTPIGENRP